ncbi:MAG: TRL domain-containing protein [Flavobacteriales bacterium]|jgi:predicted small lipoprotein YifL
MKRIITNSLVALSILALTSCSISGPLFITDNAGGTDSKKGESSYTIVFGFMPFNADASIVTAARNGDITKVATVDQKITGNFFTTKVTTIVTGE